MSFIHTFDWRLTTAVQKLPRRWQPVMSALSFLGEPVVVLAVGAAGLLTAINSSNDALAQVFLFAVAAFCLNIVLKFILHRRRPNNLIIETLGVNSYSFPSGHAFGTMIFYGLIAYLDIKYLASPWNYFFGVFISSIIFMIGISRVYLQAHYPSDVLGGWLLGGISLAVTVIIGF